MDPTACLLRWMNAIKENDRAEARAAHADLLAWLNAGGFPPSWSDATRDHFFTWEG